MLINYRIRLSSPEFLFNCQTDVSENLLAKIENIELFESVLANKVNTQFALALNSGTSALHLSLILAGVAEGDEVICPDFTFAATINPVLYQKATPIFVDSEMATWNLNPSLLEYAIQDRIKQGNKPKAVIVVHAYGVPADIEAIANICTKYEIFLIEDAAGALGSSYKNKMLGAWGDIGIFSFNNNKIISTGGGGALVTNNGKLFSKGKYLADQAKSLNVEHYEHLEVGYNYRINILGATWGTHELKNLNNKIRHRRSIFSYYWNNLNFNHNLTFLEENEFSFSNRWLTTMTVNRSWDIRELKSLFNNKKIEVRYLWKPMHTQPVFADFPRYLDRVSEELFQTGLCLPSGNDLTLENQEEIISVIKDFFS